MMSDPNGTLRPAIAEIIRKNVGKEDNVDAIVDQIMETMAKPEHRYWQPAPGKACIHCHRVIGTFAGCWVGGCPSGEDM
jgi:hypothetical protein